MLAHVPSFGQNPRNAPDFLGYPVPKACMHILGTRVPRRLNVARSASSPKAAQALGCSLTLGLRISFGRFSCMARAASVPRLWTLGFPTVVWCYCLGLGCRWVWISVTPPVLAGVLGGCVWVRFVVSSLFCRLGFVAFVVGLGFWRASHLSLLGIWDARGCVRALPAPRRFRFRCAVWACPLGSVFRLRPPVLRGGVGVCVCSCARPVWSPAPPGWGCCVGVRVCACALLVPRLSWLGCACGRACWARVSAVPRSSWLGCRNFFFFACPALALWCWSLAVPVLGVVVPVPPSPLFRAGLLAPFIFIRAWCVSARFGCPFPRWAAAPGLVLPALAGLSPCAPLGSCPWWLLGGGFGRPLWCWRAVWWLWAVLSPSPLPPSFLLGWRVCLFLPLPSLGWRTHWCAFCVVAFCLAASRPHGSGGLCTRSGRRPFLPG